MSMQWRHEWKYLIHQSMLEVLKQRLLALMDEDVHHTKSDGYTIRSLYFDTIDDQCMNENEAGIDIRKKYRIRYYGLDHTKLHLETKLKNSGLCAKRSTVIDPIIADHLFHGQTMDILLNIQDDPQLIGMVSDYQRLLLQPKVLIEYDRYALVYPSGNVRITFDCNIRKSSAMHLFYSTDVPWFNIHEPGWHILEVKYDDLLPSFIANILDDFHLTQIANSKYYLARIA